MAYLMYKKYTRVAEENMNILRKDSERESAIKKEALIAAKEAVKSERDRLIEETRDRRQEFTRMEEKLTKRENSIEDKLQSIAEREAKIDKQKDELVEKENEIADLERKHIEELERVSGLSVDDAKNLLLDKLRADLQQESNQLIRENEMRIKEDADQKAKEILTTVMQRCLIDQVVESTVSVVQLPSDEMKGRIIGREGRNIRTLETLTGVDFIIDDTPEAVVISCFDPVRKEIAKQALERLVTDGRIHPARIEEIVQKVTREVQQKIYEEGEKALFDLGIHNMNQDGVRALGRLYFRTSYGQNVLTHSKEVAEIATLIAGEVGANRELAKRAALLHDIGKGAENDSDKNHAEVGAEMARKFGEDQKVINAIAAHHQDCEPATLEAVIVQIADAISAARPGARKETADNYVKRLENLEEIAEKFQGVEKAYAIQAGRELRILVNNDKIPDEQVKDLAKQIAKQIETDLRYPGRIKITMIRETRIIEYAR